MIAKSVFRKAISAVLKEFDIDDLALEGSLATAIYGYFLRLEAGEDKNLVEGDMLDAFEREHADIKYRANLIERIERSMKLNINESIWRETLKFIERMEREYGHKIETYQQWREDDPFNSPKAHQIANKPALIKATWPQAFPEGKQLSLLQTADGGFDL